MKKENDILSMIRQGFSGFGSELINNARTSNNQVIDDAVLEETLLGIDKATAAMLEVGVDENDIKDMLVKHWDLKPSEASSFVNYHKRSFKE